MSTYINYMHYSESLHSSCSNESDMVELCDCCIQLIKYHDVMELVVDAIHIIRTY